MFSVWVAAIAVLTVLTAAVVAVRGPLPAEVQVIRWFQGFGRPVPALAAVVHAVTGTEANLVLGFVPALWLIRRRGRRGAAAAVVCLVAMLFVQPVSKEIVDRDRPTELEVDVRAEHSSRSYPSGHSLSTTVVWGVAVGVASTADRSRWAYWLCVPILASAPAGVILGVHWPTDAIAGTIVGAVAAALAVRTLSRATT